MSIDWTKPVETTDGAPIVAVIHDYHVGAGLKKTAVIVRGTTMDSIHFVSEDTGLSSYKDRGGVDVRNVGHD